MRPDLAARLRLRLLLVEHRIPDAAALMATHGAAGRDLSPTLAGWLSTHVTDALVLSSQLIVLRPVLLEQLLDCNFTYLLKDFSTPFQLRVDLAWSQLEHAAERLDARPDDLVRSRVLALTERQAALVASEVPDLDTAFRHFTAAAGLFDQVLGSPPHDIGRCADLLEVLLDLVGLFLECGDLQGAEEHDDAARRLVHALEDGIDPFAPDPPEIRALAMAVVQHESRLGNIWDDPAGAYRHVDVGLRSAKEHASDAPESLFWRRMIHRLTNQ
jgi:hypothetical protein